MSFHDILSILHLNFINPLQLNFLGDYKYFFYVDFVLVLLVLIHLEIEFLWYYIQEVITMVQQDMQYIDETPDLDTRVELIKTLNNVSAGKVCVFILSLYYFF